MKRDFELDESANSFFCASTEIETEIKFEGLRRLAKAYEDESCENRDVLAIWHAYGFTHDDYCMLEDITEEECENLTGSFTFVFYNIFNWVAIMQSKYLEIMYNKEYGGKVRKEILPILTRIVTDPFNK